MMARTISLTALDRRIEQIRSAKRKETRMFNKVTQGECLRSSEPLYSDLKGIGKALNPHTEEN